MFTFVCCLKTGRSKVEAVNRLFGARVERYKQNTGSLHEDRYLDNKLTVNKGILGLQQLDLSLPHLPRP